MHVTLCTAVWRRHALTRLWWRGARRICRRFQSHGVATRLIVAGSEPAHAKLARQHGAVWLRRRNDPLGAKWNATTEAAAKLGTDAVLILGSDDFLSDAIVDRYVQHLHDGWLYLGLGGIYFYEPTTHRLALYQLPIARTASKHGAPIGAGRLMLIKLLESVRFRPWQDGLNRRLDASMTHHCQLPAARLIRVGPGMEALDVKTAANLWSFDVLHERYPKLKLREGPLAGIPEWEAIRTLR